MTKYIDRMLALAYLMFWAGLCFGMIGLPLDKSVDKFTLGGAIALFAINLFAMAAGYLAGKEAKP